MRRRAWLWGAAALGTTIPLSFLWTARLRNPVREFSQLKQRSGPLLLPEGFSCRVLSTAGERLGDGSRSADAPDGMACFQGPNDTWLLLRNHELAATPALGSYPEASPHEAYDPKMHGGVSRLVLHATDCSVISSNTVLTGTSRNCGGGPSPWGWLSCEETEDEGHGYVFLCPPDSARLLPAERIPGYGRFRHEAVAVDPSTCVAYLTEDQPDGCFYRFTPRSLDSPFEGRLEALRVIDRPRFDTSRELRPGRHLPVEWVPVADPEATRESTRRQAQKSGAARIARGEGAWLDTSSVVFTATSGGPIELGQILRLRFGRAGTGDTLEVVTEATDRDSLRGPDNITVAPWGDLVIAEDGPRDQHLWGLTSGGKLYPIAKNAQSDGEFAGVCFSPDGSTLFCNLQREGLTLAIQGPLRALARRA